MNGVEGILLDLISILQNMLMVCGIFCVPLSKNKRYFVYGGILLAVSCFGEILLGYDHFVMLIVRSCSNPAIILAGSGGGNMFYESGETLWELLKRLFGW